LISKFDHFEAWICNISPDVVAVAESWTNKNILDSEISVPGYSLFRRDRSVDREGGGVLLYVRSVLQPAEFVPDSNFPEQVWCRILDSAGEDFYIGVCYRTPTDSIFGSGNHDTLRDLINTFGESNKHFVLMGDFNYSFKKWPSDCVADVLTEEARKFVDCLDDNFLTQHVTFPTRKNAILDLVITDEQDMIHEVTDLGALDNSDHSALLWSTRVRTESTLRSHCVFDYAKADIAGMKLELRGTNWHELFGTLPIEDSWSAFKHRIQEIEARYIPVRSVRLGKTKPIWMSYKALKSVKRRHKVHRKYKDNNHPACKKADKLASADVKKSRRHFERRLAQKIKDDKKSFFAYARSKTKSRVQVGPLRDGSGQEVNEAGAMAEVFNEQFSSVFTAEDTANIPLPQDIFRGGESDRLKDITISVDAVKVRLNKLREDKSPGVDDMSPRLLRMISEEIAYPTTVLFNQSMNEGDVPLDWKLANVTPIFKKGSRNQPENYRPVSLTSQLSKVMESVIRDVITEHLDRHKLIRDSQHGFRRGRSCTTNILEFLDMVTDVINQKENVDVIFLDFAKAFDKVPHRRLLAKLQSHGIDGKVVRWVASWLKGRKQRVCIDGSSSHWADVLSGIPQGSVLGPLLFLIFINDLEDGIISVILKFADDTKIFRKVTSATDGLRLQQDLNRLCDWADKWQMEFNIAKCKTMHIGRGSIEYDYSMRGHQLDVVTTEKDLGVLISSNLKVAEHCYEAYCKANRMLGLLKRTVKYRNPDTMVRLYKSLVRPHLEYSSPAWSPHYRKDKLLLERVQHRFTLLFDDLKSLEYQERLVKLKLWSLEERRNRADLIELFKMVKGISTVPLQTFFKLADGSRTRGHRWKLVKEHSRCDARLHFFSVRVLNRWNSLPQSAVQVNSVNCFKNQLDKLRINQMDFFMDD